MDQRLLNYLQPRISESEFGNVKAALELAKKAHGDQLRQSGEPYIIHPIAVAELLAHLALDSTTIIAGILHDLPEDTDVTIEQISKQFGKEVAHLVKGVTKLSKVRLKKSWFGLGPTKLEEIPEFERQVATLRRMFLATSRDIRVVLIKLADRLHNMRTLNYVKPEKQTRIARETLDIYAPLADKLGIGQWKGELEDLSFPYLYPQEARELKALVGKELAKREHEVEKTRRAILKFTSLAHIPIIDIHGRVKRNYSLWKKLQRYENDITRIYDLVALRIIVKNESDCYGVLGLIHKHWRPLPDRIKDYIALPKPNGYRSLHTTVSGPGGHILEIQIRDEKMHHEAEQGIAAHWYYGEQKNLSSKFYLSKKTQPVPKEQVAWVQELAAWQKTVTDPNEYKRGLEFDFFKGRIFVFTPQGDVKDLPIGSTPIDFAFAVHSQIGHRCAGAKVNGRIVQLNYQLQNGDVVEILTSKKTNGPRRDWLNFVKSSFARGRIRRFIRDEHGPILPKSLDIPRKPR